MEVTVPPTPGYGTDLMPQTITEAMRLAEMMAKGKLVPDHLRNPSDMLMVIEQARRWRMSPFAVAQCTAIVRGRMSYEGKLVAAALNSSGLLQERLSYEFSGAGPALKVVARATIRGESKPREVEVTLADAKTDNEHWKKSPEQMLTYHSARVWGRRHTPEVMLGVYSAEEFDQPKEVFRGTTLDAEPEEPIVSEPTTGPAPPPPDDNRNHRITLWLDGLEIELRDACGAAEDKQLVDAILARDDVQRAQDVFRGANAERLAAMIKAAIASVNTEVT